MKIRKRITYTFTILFGVLILGLCLLVYVMSVSTQEQLFFNLLDKRLNITEQFFLESDSFSEEVRDKVRDNFLKTLPEEIEYVDTLANFSAPESVLKHLPDDFMGKISAESSLTWNSDNLQGIARVYNIQEVEYVVLVIACDRNGKAYIARLRNILILSFLSTVLITFLLSNYFSRRVLKPIAGKINKANAISASNLDMRLTVYNENDELGMLALSFNKLLDRLQKAFELEKNFVRYVSHELKNPLAVILGEAEVTLLKKRTDSEYVETIERIKRKAERLNMLVNHFLELSKLESFQVTKQKVSLDETLLDITSNLTPYYEKVKIDFSISEDGDPDDYIVEADGQLMYNALYNLVENACKFSHSGGRVTISLDKSNSRTMVSIRDEGIGIEAEHLAHIYKPLYRGGNAREIDGTGIGLALVERIIYLHGGEIKVDSHLGRGTTFIVTL